jgi:hypothetical protein
MLTADCLLVALAMDLELARLQVQADHTAAIRMEQLRLRGHPWHQRFSAEAYAARNDIDGGYSWLGIPCQIHPGFNA